MGDFTSLILPGLHLTPDASFRAKTEAVRRTLFEAQEHRHFGGVEFIHELGKYHDIGNRAAVRVLQVRNGKIL